MTALQTRFEQLIEDQRKLREKFQEQAKGMFKETFKEFFDKNPGITAVVWTQYTPYFNDGDTCTFGVGDVSFTNAPPEELENVTSWGEYDGDDETVWAATNIDYILRTESSWYTEIAAKIRATPGIDTASCDALSKLVGNTEMEDVLLAMFDDHVKVIATRDGFDVSEYDHD